MKAILKNALLVALFASAYLTKMPELVSISVAVGWILAVFLSVASIMLLVLSATAYANLDDHESPVRAAVALKSLSAGPFVRWSGFVLTGVMVALLAAMGATVTAIVFGVAWLVVSQPCTWVSRHLLEKTVDSAPLKS